jgi:hypothetical protein
MSGHSITIPVDVMLDLKNGDKISVNHEVVTIVDMEPGEMVFQRHDGTFFKEFVFVEEE